MSNDYGRLELEHAKEPRRIADHSLAWARLEPVAAVNGTLRGRIEAFAEAKQISMAALTALGTRVETTKPGGVRLAWGYEAFRAGRTIVSAVKYRDIAAGTRSALKPSVFLEPLVVGNRHALDVFVAEGETDAARLYDLVGDAAQILVLPAGAQTWKPSWASYLPRGAVIHLALDADVDGDEGAEKIRRTLGTGIRVRPPDGTKDWCAWQGDRAEFIELVQAARKVSAVSPLGGEAWDVFRDSATGDLPFLIDGVWPEGATAFIGAEPKAGKTWLALAIAVSCVTGRDLFGLHAVAKSVPVVYVALEGHRAAIRARIGCIARGVGVDPEGAELGHLHIIYKPRGFNLSDADWARWLCEYATETGARLVLIDTLRSAATIRESNEGAGDMAKLLKLLNPITADHVSVGFLHHYTKLNEQRQQRAAADRMSGSGALRGHLDFGLFITKADFTERRMRVELEVRDGVALDPFGVRLDGVGSGAYGGFTYTDTARLVIDDEVLGEQEVKAPSGEIAAWIKAQPLGSATPKQIRDHFDISERTLRNRRDMICTWGIEYIDAGRFSQYRAADPVPRTDPGHD
jgi:hypothetical protein